MRVCSQSACGRALGRFSGPGCVGWLRAGRAACAGFGHVDHAAVFHAVGHAGFGALAFADGAAGLVVLQFFALLDDDFHVGLAFVFDDGDALRGEGVDGAAGHCQQKGGDDDEKDVDEIDDGQQGVVVFDVVQQAGWAAGAHGCAPAGSSSCGAWRRRSMASRSCAYQRRRTWTVA